MPLTDDNTDQEIGSIESSLRTAMSAARATQPGPGRLEIRCRIPVVMNAPGGAYRFVSKPDADPAEPVARAMADGKADPEHQCATLDRIEGPASSTSQDWYGTRMTKDCLEGMAAQFRAGVDYLPRHHSRDANLEWSDVIGRTVDARVERANVRAAPAGEETQDQYVLYATMDLYDDCKLAKKLVSRIRGGHAPGQSIGGWFTQISVQYDEDGCVVYPISVLAADLDHLAAVRSPANPDADKVWLAVQRGLGHKPTPVPVPEPVQLAAEPARAPEPVGDILVTLDGHAIARAIDAHFQFNRSGSGAPALAPAPTTEERAQEDQMPMSETELAELIRSTVAGAIAPVVADIETLRAAQRSATPVPVPAPVQEDATVVALRAQLARAEAERDRLAAEPVRVAARAAAPAPAPAPAAVPAPEVPEMFRSRTGSDLRTVAPIAVRMVVRSGGEIPLSAGLVVRHDGMPGLMNFAKAQGEARNTVDLAERFTQLTADPVRWGQNGDHGVYSRAGTLRADAARGKIDLQGVLSDILYSADADGLLSGVFSA